MKEECKGDFVLVNGKTYPCSVSLTMGLVGGKWKTVILYHLMEGEKRFSELRKSMPSVTEMTLSLQLKQLEKDDLIARQVYGEKPPVKVMYSLTDFGKSFTPVLETITNWGNEVIRKKGTFILNKDIQK